jgi:3',5'-cyclic AMP phosphodiesterase CpdA
MFVLAHLSDPHLGPLPRPRLSELANKRGLGFVNWQIRRRSYHRGDVLDAIVKDIKANTPDHIAITGDLINIGLEGEFAPAVLWLDRLGAADDVTVVPGNHDAYVRATARHAERFWDAYMGEDGPDPFSFPFIRRRGPLALIGVSTAVPTAPFAATGKVGAEQLGRLSNILAELEREGIFRVVLIHHPPVSISGARHKRLLDAEAVRHVLSERGAELVLHGHEHLHSLVWIDGPRRRIPVVGVPSASAASDDLDPAAYNLYRIEGGAGAWQCEVVSRGLKLGHGGIVELARHTLSEA